MALSETGGLPRPIKEALIRLGACSGVRMERTPEGGGRMILRGVDETSEERIGFNLSDADIFVEAYEQMREALNEDTSLLPEEFENRVNITRRHAYGPIYEAAHKRWQKKDH